MRFNERPAMKPSPQTCIPRKLRKRRRTVKETRVIDLTEDEGC